MDAAGAKRSCSFARKRRHLALARPVLLKRPGGIFVSEARRMSIKPPPRGEDLPFSDGEPMESDRHVHQMGLLIGALRDAWRDRDDFHVGGNNFVYFSETQARNNDFRGPDVYVVMDTPKRERKSWVVWEEAGRTPDVVIELLSETTEHVDRGDKMRIYAKLLHVSEYYLFDPFTAVFEAYALDASTRTYGRREPDLPGGDFSSAATGLVLGVRPGTIHDIEARWLRWIRPDGYVLPFGLEHRDAERARADAEKVRADAETVRADAEKARADAALARLAAYEAERARG